MKPLKSAISYSALGTVLGLVLIGGAPAANAQTVITARPVATQTVTVTTRTVRTLPRRREVITTRRVTERVVPTRPIYDEVIPAPAITVPQPIYNRPIYDEVAPAPAAAVVATPPAYTPPLYDEVVATPPAPVIDNGSIVATQPYVYRYVYEPSRILVIDPATGIAVQSIPR